MLIYEFVFCPLQETKTSPFLGKDPSIFRKLTDGSNAHYLPDLFLNREEGCFDVLMIRMNAF